MLLDLPLALQMEESTKTRTNAPQTVKSELLNNKGDHVIEAEFG